MHYLCLAHSELLMAKFTQSQIEALAAALGDTNVGLTGREISYLLSVATLNDPGEGLAKRYRLHNAFADSQNGRGDRGAILKFLRQSMKPERYLREPDRFEPLRAKVNAALLFAGLAFNEAGVLQSADTVVTLSDAERRARELRADMELRGVHDDVLRFCRSELLVDNYFHAALEAVKSIGDKLRARTGLQDDGAALVDRVLGGEKPILAINPLTTKSERDEQKGFANLLKGVFGMFRNPTAHEAKINWEMSRADAEDLLTLASLIHRRIDLAHMPSRV